MGLQAVAEPPPVTVVLEAKRQQLDDIASKLIILEDTVRKHRSPSSCCKSGCGPGCVLRLTSPACPRGRPRGGGCTDAPAAQVKSRESAVADAETSLIQAEESSSEAMLMAEGAVHDELEAFTVAKEIQSAFSKALNDLAALNAVYEANTNATKSKEQAQAESDTMVCPPLSRASGKMPGPFQPGGGAPAQPADTALHCAAMIVDQLRCQLVSAWPQRSKVSLKTSHSQVLAPAPDAWQPRLQAEATSRAKKAISETRLDLPGADKLLAASNGKPAAKAPPQRTQTVDLDARPAASAKVGCTAASAALRQALGLPSCAGSVRLLR